MSVSRIWRSLREFTVSLSNFFSVLAFSVLLFVASSDSFAVRVSVDWMTAGCVVKFMVDSFSMSASSSRYRWRFGSYRILWFTICVKCPLRHLYSHWMFQHLHQARQSTSSQKYTNIVQTNQNYNLHQSGPAVDIEYLPLRKVMAPDLGTYRNMTNSNSFRNCKTCKRSDFSASMEWPERRQTELNKY